MLKEPIFIWQEITRKVFEGNSCLYQEYRVDCLIVFDDNGSG